MKRLRATSGQLLGALLLLLAAWTAGRLLRPATEIQSLPGHALVPGAEMHDSSLTYLSGDLSTAASRRLVPHPPGPDGVRVVALLRAADWQSCEDLGRQLRELQRLLASSNSRLLVWTEPADIRLMERRLKRERVAAAVSAGPALDNIFFEARPVPTPAVLVVSGDARADGIAHTRRMPNVRTRSFAEELPLLPQFPRPSARMLNTGTGPLSTSESESPR